ncbi:MAG: hypothetical protein HWE25_09435 [Alphaproteobacteria bacterium]|nr:hypothetical protein [Alphaproteobacteria bacterium]
MSLKTYYGWIPTIGGRLLFSEIGTKTNPRSRAFNKSDRDQALVFVEQIKKTSDELFPFTFLLPLWNFIASLLNYPLRWLKWREFPVYERWTVRLIAGKVSKTGNDVSFHGVVLVFPKYDYPRKLAHQMFDSHQVLRRENFKRIYRRADWRYFFRLQKNGVVRLQERFAPDFQAVLSSDVDEEHRRASISKQAFYFLRDACHTHRHHDPNNDQHTTIHDKDNSKWPREVLRLLYRATTKHSRAGASREDLRQALGILAYTRSFKKIAEADPAIGPDFSGYEGIDGQQIADSINIRIADIVELDREKDAASLKWLGPWIASLSLMIGFVALGTFLINLWANPAITGGTVAPEHLNALQSYQPTPWLLTISKYLAENFVIVATGWLLFLMAFVGKIRSRILRFFQVQDLFKATLGLYGLPKILMNSFLILAASSIIYFVVPHMIRVFTG